MKGEDFFFDLLGFLGPVISLKILKLNLYVVKMLIHLSLDSSCIQYFCAF